MRPPASLVAPTADSAVATLEVAGAVIFAPRFRLDWRDAGGTTRSSESDAWIGWLPRGSYAVRMPLPSGTSDATLTMTHRQSLRDESVSCRIPGAGTHRDGGWSIEAISPTPPLSQLSWSKGHADWFFRHFDHAATTVITYLLGDHPLLRGRILDVGCGDGITDLSIALRTQCEELVGVEPFRQYERLPKIVAVFVIS
jgi:hypothetical protein